MSRALGWCSYISRRLRQVHHKCKVRLDYLAKAYLKMEKKKKEKEG